MTTYQQLPQLWKYNKPVNNTGAVFPPILDLKIKLTLIQILLAILKIQQAYKYYVVTVIQEQGSAMTTKS